MGRGGERGELEEGQYTILSNGMLLWLGKKCGEQGVMLLSLQAERRGGRKEVHFTVASQVFLGKVGKNYAVETYRKEGRPRECRALLDYVLIIPRR